MSNDACISHLQRCVFCGCVSSEFLPRLIVNTWVRAECNAGLVVTCLKTCILAMRGELLDSDQRFHASYTHTIYAHNHVYGVRARRCMINARESQAKGSTPRPLWGQLNVHKRLCSWLASPTVCCITCAPHAVARLDKLPHTSCSAGQPFNIRCSGDYYKQDQHRPTD